VVYLLISTSVWDQSGIIIGVYVSLKDDLERIKARNDAEVVILISRRVSLVIYKFLYDQKSGPTFDLNIRLGPKLDPNMTIKASERRCAKY
jgi:hypothetical protein